MAALVRTGGRAASALGAANRDELAAREVTATNVMADSSDRTALDRLAELADAGELKVTIDAVHTLEETPAALERFSSGKRGKIVISLAGR